MTLVFIRPISLRLGAEEQDAESTEKYLSLIHARVHVFELSRGSDLLHHRFYQSGRLKSYEDIDLVKKGSPKNYLMRLLILDAGARSYLNVNIAETIESFLNKQNIEIDFLISHTTALVGVSMIIPTKNRISRSLNFEPLHYLQENSISFRSPLVFLSKIYLTIIERFFFNIWVISPKDFKRYSYIYSKRKIELYPLLQLFDMCPIKSEDFSEVLKVGFLGSTYNVKHNRASFDFITDKLAPAMIKINQRNVHFNIYGVKSPFRQATPNVTIHGWKDSIDAIIKENDLFITPYFGGTGMQSKLFEPLVKGKPVIADPKAFAGYPFIANLHYYGAELLTDYIEHLDKLATRKLNLLSYVDNSNKLIRDLFSKDKLLSRIRISLQDL